MNNSSTLNKKITIAVKERNSFVDGSFIYNDLFSTFAEIKESIGGESWDSTESKDTANIKLTLTVRDTANTRGIKANQYLKYKGIIHKITSSISFVENGFLEFTAERVF